MGRFICPGGSISSARLRAVAKAIAGEGEGFADVTTRGDLLLEAPEAELAALRAAPEEQASAQEAGGGPLPREADPVGVHEQAPGFFRVGVPLAAGRVTARQLAKAADLAERHGDAVVRFTARQGLLFLNVPQEKVVNLLEGLQSVELKPQGSMLRRGLTACSESDPCLEGWSLVSRRAQEIVEHLEKQVLLIEPLRVRVAGPACACAAPADEEVTVAAAKPEAERPGDLYDVRVGGGALASGVPGEEVKFFLERLLVNWKRRRQTGEALGAFCARAGREQVARWLEQEARAA